MQRLEVRAVLLVGALAVLGAAPLAGAGNDLAEAVVGPVEGACDDVIAPGDAACEDAAEVLDGVMGGLERFAGGVSYDDCRDDDACEVEVANFYFASRAVILHDGQTVVWSNGNPPGGNRHSVMSSDWGCAAEGSGCDPVLPVPGANFGGGAGFRQALQPGEAFAFTVDLAAMDPHAYLALDDGTALVAYHCYIHGAATMNAFLLVAPEA